MSVDLELTMRLASRRAEEVFFSRRTRLKQVAPSLTLPRFAGEGIRIEDWIMWLASRVRSRFDLRLFASPREYSFFRLGELVWFSRVFLCYEITN